MLRSKWCYHCSQPISCEHYEAHVRKVVRSLAGNPEELPDFLEDWIVERIDTDATIAEEFDD